MAAAAVRAWSKSVSFSGLCRWLMSVSTTACQSRRHRSVLALPRRQIIRFLLRRDAHVDSATTAVDGSRGGARGEQRNHAPQSGACRPPLPPARCNSYTRMVDLHTVGPKFTRPARRTAAKSSIDMYRQLPTARANPPAAAAAVDRRDRRADGH